MTPIYKFLLNKVPIVGAGVEVYPIWKDDLALEYTMESNQMFHRAQLSGGIVFIRDDYDRVMGEPFGTEFYIYIKISNDNGTTWADYWTGRFTLTDCTINVDDRQMTIKPTVVDRYTRILEGMEKEYDLIKLTPVIERVLVRKRPCLQIYAQDDDTVSCIYGNLSFEQDADVPSTYDNVEDFLRDRCQFAVIDSFTEMNFTTIASGYESDFQAPFSGIIMQDGDILTNSANTYYIEYFEFYEVVQGQDYVIQHNGLDIKRRSDGEICWHFEQIRREKYKYDIYEALPLEITFGSEMEGVDDMVAERTTTNTYSRIVCNVENMGTYPTGELYSDDLVAYNRNYRRAYPYKATIYQSSRATSTPTEWGRRDDGQYFLPPDDNNDYIPIGRSRWVNTSLWFKKTSDFDRWESKGTYAYMLNDTFPLWSVLSVLLAEVAPALSFAGTSVYSAFLYSGDDAVGGRDNRLYLAPKSNITAGEYQTPAQTCPVTLKQVLDMLRDTYRCYWFVDSSNRLRIEHVSYFMRGGSYSGSPAVGIDLTTLPNVRNGKKWSYGKNVYEYDKVQMAERYEFNWMDDVTSLFKGNPIDVDSPYVQLGKVEDTTVAGFTSDIDYMLLNPSGINPDGMALMNVEQANAITGSGAHTYMSGYQGDIIAIADYVWEKDCLLNVWMYGGSGTLTLQFWYGDRMETTNITVNVSTGYHTLNVYIPEGVTGISFEASNTTDVTFEWLRVQYDVTTVQLPLIDVTIGHTTYRMQNGYLSFYKLQNPYWLYDMPARSLRVNGAAVQAVMIQKGKKQSVNIPLAATDPDMNQLVKTGIGNGKIKQCSIRLTSRMAKTELIYDTE